MQKLCNQVFFFNIYTENKDEEIRKKAVKINC